MQTASPASEAAAAEVLGTVGLSFERNDGQTDARVDFLARGAGYTLFLTPTEAVFSVSKPHKDEPAEQPGTEVRHPRTLEKPDVLRMKFLGAGTAQRAVGVEELPGRSNYFIGNDPSKWHTDVPHFAKVRYEEVYSGIDLVYYGNERQLEYDFVVEPGADPSAIQMEFDGARGLRVDESGDLVVQMEGGGELRQRRPLAYQEDETGRREVAGRYVVEGGRVEVRVGAYDAARPLVIDPVSFVYSSYLGGSKEEYGSGIAVDASGSAYVTGYTTSTNFPLASPFQGSYGGGDFDAFVAKVNPAGTALVYSSYLGGGYYDQALGIAVDGSGAAYVTGYTNSTNFPTVSPFQGSFGGGLYDAFVTKVNPSGSALAYSSYLGGGYARPDFDWGTGIAVDASGAAYVTGYTYAINFPLASPFQGSLGGSGADAFVAKVNPAGTALVYSSYLGGGDNDQGNGIAVDASGAAYVTGHTTSTNFPTVSPFQGSFGGDVFTDAFVAKVNPAGTALAYSSYLGGGSSDRGLRIAVDGSGAAYVTGYTKSPNFPLASPFQGSFGGGPYDAFVAKVNPAGTALVYSSYLGGGDEEYGNGIAVDASGAAYVTGYTYSTNFPLASPFQGSFGGGFTDAFVAKVNPAGTALVYSSFLGGGNGDRGNGIAVEGSGAAYITGVTASPNFPLASPFQGSWGGGLNEAFVAKIHDGSHGADTVGIFFGNSSFYFLRNSNSSGDGNEVFGYGPPNSGWVALRGDWDGDGDDTPGLYDPASGFFFLKNSNEAGDADLVFSFGPGGLGWLPVVGDWDGDGDDTIGVYAPESSFFFLKDENAPGNADLVFGFGPANLGWQPVVGDWDGDGDDTVGLYAPESSFFFLRKENAAGNADLVFGYGPANLGWTPLAGDYDGDGDDTVGLYAPESRFFFLKNTNEAGSGDLVFGYGGPGATPLVGDWDGF